MSRTSASLLLALLLAACAAGCGSQAASTVPQRTAAPLVSILQDDGFVEADPVPALMTLRALGVTTLRVNLYWTGVAPDPSSRVAPAFSATSPGAYSAAGFAPYDAVDRAAAQVGITVYFTLTGPAPLWAAGADPPPRIRAAGAWKPDAAAFALFAQAVGRRYSGSYTSAGATSPLPRVHFWSIWNEPNYGVTLAPTSMHRGATITSAEIYRGLLDAGWSGLARSGHTPATDTILIGETAPRGIFVTNGTPPLPFIRALYCVSASDAPLRGDAATAVGCPATAAGSASFAARNPGLFGATGWAIHPYPDTEPPTVRTPDAAGGAGYADFAALGNLAATLDAVTRAYGRSVRLPIYSTEFGYRTIPPGAATYAVPLTDAAEWLNEAEYLSWINPRIRSYNQYLLLDPPGAANQHFFNGLMFSSGAPKPFVYDSYRLPLWLPATHGAAHRSLQVWGCARAAPVVARATGRAQHVQIEFAAGRAAFRTVDTVTVGGRSGCYFDVDVRFPGTGTVRLAYRAPAGTQYSRSQPITGS